MTEDEVGRIAELTQARVEATALRLEGSTVLAEAATGAYASTAGAAALAGAQVCAFAAESVFGSIEQAISDVRRVSGRLGVDQGIDFKTNRSLLPFDRADIVTNSGVLRPITSHDLQRMRRGAVVALMYESWEARDVDIDYRTAAALGVEVVGVNEQHPYCGAFEYLGDVVGRALERRRWYKADLRIGVLSDNSFVDPITSRLEKSGLSVHSMSVEAPVPCDVVVVAHRPASVIGGRSSSELTAAVLHSGAQACVVVWGDIDYEMLERAAVELEPRVPPRPGHQGLGMHEAGFEAVVRLQVGGLAAVTYKEARPGDASYGLAQRHVEAISRHGSHLA